MSAWGGKKHDALVIGSGFGGLTAACVLARRGLETVVLEAGAKAGGCCKRYEENGLAWNLSLYSLRGCRQGGPFVHLLEELGFSGERQFLHSRGSYLVRAGEAFMPVTSELEEMVEGAERFERGGADGMKRLLDGLINFHPVRDYSLLSGETFADAAARYGVSGGLLDSVGAPLMVSLGLPPSRVSAYFAFMKYQLLLQGGVSYPKGGSDSLVDAFLHAFDRAGGDVYFNEQVVALDPCPSGGWEVRTSRNGTFTAKYIVFSGDASSALEMLGSRLPARLAARPRGLVPSLPVAILFLEAQAETFTSLALDVWPHVIVLPEDGLETHYRNLWSGKTHERGSFLGLTSPATWEPPPDGRDTRPLTAFFLAARGESPDFQSLLRTVEQSTGTAPGSLSLRCALGPGDIHRMTLNRDGAFCGWEMGPERYSPARLPQKLLPGFYLAGHWVDPGPSLLNAALSGRKAALGILHEAGAELNEEDNRGGQGTDIKTEVNPFPSSDCV